MTANPTVPTDIDSTTAEFGGQIAGHEQPTSASWFCSSKATLTSKFFVSSTAAALLAVSLPHNINRDVASQTATKAPYRQSEKTQTPASRSPDLEEKTRSEKLEQLYSMLSEFRKRETNWDGYNGVSAPSSIISDAKRFVGSLPSGAPLPRATLSSSGDVAFIWDYGDGFIDVGFEGESFYSFYARSADGQEYFGDDHLIKDGLDSDLGTLVSNYSAA